MYGMFKFQSDFALEVWFSIYTPFLNPKQAPKNVSGKDTPSQRPSRSSMVVNGTAPLLPLIHRTVLNIRNRANTTLKLKVA